MKKEGKNPQNSRAEHTRPARRVITHSLNDHHDWGVGGGGHHLGGVVEWFWVAKYSHSCWNSCRIFVKASCEEKTCPPGYSCFIKSGCIFCILPFLCAVWAWSCCKIRTVTNTGWRLNNRSLNTGLLFLISSSVSFGLCVEYVVVTIVREMSN